MPPATAALPRSRLATVLLCFFLSGAAGLIYQVAWTRALGLVFGHTVYAIAAVLAAFMGGLAVGSAYLGSWGQRSGRPIAIYGWIEILTGISGALSLAGVRGVHYLYVAAYHIAAGSTALLIVLRLLASVLVLFVPTFLMGGTLPILAGGLSRGSAELGSRLGRLYWVNTAGAVSGALAAGFLLLPGIGLRRTVFVAVILNLAVGAIALYSAKEELPITAKEEAIPSSDEAIKIPKYLLVAFGFVGATAMVYEVAWSRLLATTLGSSTYSFTLMLATFLAGIAIGSRLFESWVRRGRNVSVGAFAITQILTGLGALFFLLLFARLPALFWTLITATDKTFHGLVGSQFAICILAMLPAALVFGLNFPLVTLLIAGPKSSERPASAAVGRACAANTAGAIVGSIAAGFWLVPILGSFRLVVWTATGNLALAFFLLACERPRRAYKLAGISALAGLVLIAGYSGTLNDPAVTSLGVITNRNNYNTALSTDELAHMTDLLFVKDGLNATISVRRTEDYLGLATNGKVDASTKDSRTQSMAGHLGMIFHSPAPKRVLIIGFGSGMTVSAVARYRDVEEIDCVEIEPAVIGAAAYLKPLNRDVLRDPRLHLILDDARNFLFTTDKKYDVIISEPSNPWIAGVADLFTDEFYHQVRTHLASGGMLVQWVQLYSIFPSDVRMVLSTVAGEFPQVTLWNGVLGDVLLLAQTRPGTLSFDRMRRLWMEPQLRADYQQLGLSNPEGLLAYNVLGDADLRRFVANVARNTDDLNRLEYDAPRAILADKAVSENIEMLSQQGSNLIPNLFQITDRQETLLATAYVFARLGQLDREAEYLKALASYPATAESELLRARWLQFSMKLAEAHAAFENATRLNPSSAEPLLGLAEIALSQNDFATAESFLKEALKRDPQSTLTLHRYALLESARGNWAQALQWQQKLMTAEKNPSDDTQLEFAKLLWRTGDVRGAANTCAEILKRDSYNPMTRYLLAEIFDQQKNWDGARAQLEILIHYFPNGNAQEYVLLADVYRNLGNTDEAIRTIQKGERIFPENTAFARAEVRN